MDLQIIHYPHPTLRHVSKPLKRVDAELREIVRQMFELMYAAQGVGLAANQVDLPYRLFVANLKSDPDEPGEEHVFINPVIRRPKGLVEGEEGCLSIPGVYGPVKRAETVQIEAYTPSGERIEQTLEGLFARVAQHEVDHLDGVLFIDRLTPTEQKTKKDVLEEFDIVFQGRRQRGEIPPDEEIAQRWHELEALRT